VKDDQPGLRAFGLVDPDVGSRAVSLVRRAEKALKAASFSLVKEGMSSLSMSGQFMGTDTAVSVDMSGSSVPLPWKVTVVSAEDRMSETSLQLADASADASGGKTEQLLVRTATTIARPRTISLLRLLSCSTFRCRPLGLASSCCS
jgi:hypothetical protein